MGAAGEKIAGWYLTNAGLRIIGMNIKVQRGEIDLLAVDGATRVAVEVRTMTGAGDPIDAIDEPKRHQVHSLASSASAQRVDFVGIRFDAKSFDVHWLPGSW